MFVDPSGATLSRWVHLGFAAYEALDAAVMYGAAVAIGYGCTLAEGLSLGAAIPILGPPCGVGIGGALTAGYLESTAAGSEFYDFRHPGDAVK